MDGIDLKKQICNFVNSLDGLFHCKFGALAEKDSMAINEIAGGKTTATYMDGAKDKKLNYEISCKSQDIKKIEQSLNKIALAIDNLEELPSEDLSYEFSDIVATSMPFPSSKDEKGYFIYRLVLQASITTLKK